MPTRILGINLTVISVNFFDNETIQVTIFLKKPHGWPRFVCLQDDTNMPDQISVKIYITSLLLKIIIIYAFRLAQISWALTKSCNCTIPQVPLVIRLFIWQKDDLAYANVNYSHGYSLSKVSAITPCCADEENFFRKLIPHMIQLVTSWLFLLRSCVLQ